MTPEQREQQRAYQKKWKQENRERVRELGTRYYAAHREQVNERNTQRYHAKRALCEQKPRAPRVIETTPLAERFWRYVDKSGECWLWTGGKSGKGYGSVFIGRIDGKKRLGYAHRVSWELHNGPIPDSLFVCHNCPGGDNPACVNPAHLFLGTQRDNMRDCVAKGRTRNNARYDRATATEIRRRFEAGGITQTALAAEYGMSFQHLNNIVLGKRWAEG